MSYELPPDLAKALPGVIGSVVALRWIQGPPLQRVASFIGGIGSSYYGGDHAAQWLGTSTGLTGFLIGLFGMAIAAKVFEAIDHLTPGPIIARILKRWGL